MEQERLEQEAYSYARLKEEEKKYAELRKEQGSKVLEGMNELHVRKVQLDFDETTNATVAIKTRENTTVDEDRLRKAVGAKVWKKLTTAVLDPAKVEAAIKLGELDPNILSACMDTKETDYLEARFTKKRGKR